MSAVIGVVGGHGGVGASSFAAVLASVCAATLIDLDASGGGCDVLLGIEEVPGARWSAMRLGGGSLDGGALGAALPQWRMTPVLAADAPPMHVAEVVRAAGESGPVVLDLPRAAVAVRDESVALCSLVVVLAAAEVRTLVAARTLIRGLADAPVGAVIRRGTLPTAQIAEYLGAPVLGTLRRECRVEPGRPLPREAARVARGVFEGVS
jgi:hypothetical protein